ncbi:M67 family metallopeptidase [Paenibacillus apiarius]|uniref:Mov34/MPN/PAD-1 family protein n=1 Tax=Paenibacillus apiarius TaxID=46240 RepID=A0ABT4DZZ2_9BACL|nr:Mov34/MPN/PAD-1 family protein [Paenibacillus apiarius]MCY9515090.1 Mov34/MPN/PAD-1 family protein [Paenibacillus apiarius]MCY9522924.1 Mov34/MPN/PAD-1 family protein [Paenibacillus apiarius]MCY9553727.1 Mov34/MPN/PAD-1 family protein [Paenibacillus apiarius]MCY9556440.1 Mov34/MPN/PAD-1 family protein [Paenibacillus apiarius]MCY9684874.1 Mov34/MPN/PAD-1 family protein [Paenibacillus apiarius]
MLAMQDAVVNQPGMDTIYIQHAVCEAMVRNARSQLPFEACGILFKARHSRDYTHYRPLVNRAADRLHSFQPDAREWVDLVMQAEREQHTLLLVHSHPKTPPIPSAEDAEGIALSAAIFDAYIIVSFYENDEHPAIHAYRFCASSGQGTYGKPQISFKPVPIQVVR